MEIYVTIKGKVEPDKMAEFNGLFDLMVAGKTGAALETYGEDTFPAAESTLEKVLDKFEAAYDSINLESYTLEQGKLTLNFMGSYALEQILPDLQVWLLACGVKDVELEGNWV
ncbi:hypothetical protein [Saccharospirillum impatiens]|uniref:hypothetical protein n=1 Tax=Saccharospirillum impatiens TaxID=169438 RepID=UPI000422121C|nr:hypothetical protein [Saccharospirillum impatiens]